MVYRKTNVTPPDVTFIPGGLNIDSKVKIRGKAESAFAFNLQKESGLYTCDVAFHFNPRPAEGTVCMNTVLKAAGWQAEERGGVGFPFNPDSEFTICVTVSETAFVVDVNDEFFVEFAHRMPFQSVRYLTLVQGAEYYEVIIENQRGSITITDALEAGVIAEVLRNSMKDIGTDEDAIVNIMGNYTNEDRQKIATAYKTAYGKDLAEDLTSELSGDFDEIVQALMTPRFKFDAIQLNKAISGLGTDERTIIDILCTKSNAEIEQIKEEYKKEFDTELEDDLKGDTSGYFSRLLVSMVAAGRESDEWSADQALAQEDAQKLYDAGENRWGTDEVAINAILCLRSYCQLLETFNAFEAIAGKTIEESIEDECSGDLKDGYLAIVHCVRHKPSFFAMRIHDCMDGLGTDDSDLIRLVVSRSEIDMEDIKDAYKEKYGTTLEEDIKDDCDGDYKNMLIAMVNMPDA